MLPTRHLERKTHVISDDQWDDTCRQGIKSQSLTKRGIWGHASSGKDFRISYLGFSLHILSCNLDGRWKLLVAECLTLPHPQACNPSGKFSFPKTSPSWLLARCCASPRLNVIILRSASASFNRLMLLMVVAPDKFHEAELGDGVVELCKTHPV